MTFSSYISRAPALAGIVCRATGDRCGSSVGTVVCKDKHSRSGLSRAMADPSFPGMQLQETGSSARLLKEAITNRRGRALERNRCRLRNSS